MKTIIVFRSNGLRKRWYYWKDRSFLEIEIDQYADTFNIKVTEHRADGSIVEPVSCDMNGNITTEEGGAVYYSSIKEIEDDFDIKLDDELEAYPWYPSATVDELETLWKNGYITKREWEINLRAMTF